MNVTDGILWDDLTDLPDSADSAWKMGSMDNRWLYYGN